MKNISLIEYIISKEGGWKYNYEDKIIEFPEDDELISLLSANNIQPDNRRSSVYVEKHSLPFSLFFDLDEYYSEVKEKDFEKDIILFVSENQYILYKSEKTLNSENEEIEDFIFTNTLVYFDALKFLKGKANNLIDSQDLIDFFSDTTNKLIISSFDKQKLIVRFPRSGAIELDRNIDYGEDWESFKKSFTKENKNFPVFIKNSILHIFSHQREISFKEFIINLKKIIHDANRNFSIFINDLSIEKLKADYKEYKSSYFEKLNSLLSKLVNQVIALPLTFLAIAFAIDKIDNNFISVIIMIALVGITIFAVAISRHYQQDLNFIKINFDSDFKSIENSKFFNEYPEEKTDFTEVKTRFQAKYKTISSYLTSYLILTIVINLSLIGFILLSLMLDLKLIIFTLSIILISLFTLIWFLFK
ncbi:hypothetical protein SAMN05661096_01282 [Marivirga sericea]|jgi:hypothetical protein|uniref:Uncharacterized protein n=1 Tax=Marivirga sericea TaxID=1028 RepID=A0A1X7J570_9BACT|nr:hypothetical protein [Marivirga sericea]SMG22632.1 hypothetical protein SAMN05661096_01282 [Marivirga sericea]